MAQRDPFGAAGRSAGVENQGRRFGVRRLEGPASGTAVVADLEPSGWIQLDLDQLGTRRKRLPRRERFVWWDEQESCAGVFEVEPELVLFISRVERAADADHRRGEERKDRLGAVWEDCCDAIARLNTARSRRNSLPKRPRGEIGRAHV